MSTANKFRPRDANGGGDVLLLILRHLVGRLLEERHHPDISFHATVPEAGPAIAHHRLPACHNPGAAAASMALSSVPELGDIFADLAGCDLVFLARQRGSACGVAFRDLGDKGPDRGEGEVRAVAEDGVTRPGKSHEAGGVGRQLAG